MYTLHSSIHSAQCIRCKGSPRLRSQDFAQPSSAPLRLNLPEITISRCKVLYMNGNITAITLQKHMHYSPKGSVQRYRICCNGKKDWSKQHFSYNQHMQYNHVTLAHYNTITLSHYHTITLSHYYKQ